MAQINPKSGDIRANTQKILKGIMQARRREADLVVFPEMALTGYCLDEKLLSNEAFLQENRRVLMEEILPTTLGISVILGFIDFDSSRRGPDRHWVRHNAAAVIQDGRLQEVVHKRLLPAYRYFDDKRYFHPGTRTEPVAIQTREGQVSVGVLICEDLWDDDYQIKPAAIYREKGADYLFCINASPFVGCSPGRKDGKRFERDDLIRHQIQRHGLPIVYVNTVGVGDNGKNIIPFDGFSVAWDREGRRVAALQPFAEDQSEVTFSQGKAQTVPEPPFDREAEIFDALVMGVRDYYHKLGIFNGILEAVSGGIDSALGTAIAYEAVGTDLLTLYNLPSRFNTETTRRAARQLADNFGLSLKIVPIQSIVDRVLEVFESQLHPLQRSVTAENLQARIRGMLMMAESNDRQALLLTNGNETEIALGYATLYGDMVGGLAVIGDLPKPDVYRLARYVNRKWGREMIPRASLEAVPSAELELNQRDPFDYDVVGPIISDFVERVCGPEELAGAFERRDLNPEKYPGVYERYDAESFRRLAQQLYRSLNRSVYKRVQAAPIIAVSKRAFGFDLRETIINGWSGC